MFACGMRLPGNLCSWNPESWALEFGIQLKESGIPLNPESKFHWQKSEIQESMAWNQKSKSILDYLTEGYTRLLISFFYQPAWLTESLSDATVSWRLRPSDHDPGCHRYLVSDTFQSALSFECNRTARLPEWTTAMVYTEDRKPLKAADWVIIAFYFLACILVGLWVCVLFL